MEMCCAEKAVQLPLAEISGSEADNASLHLNATAGKDKKMGAAIFSADDVSSFRVRLKEVSPLPFPLDTLHLSKNVDDVCKSQNTVPLKPFGC